MARRRGPQLSPTRDYRTAPRLRGTGVVHARDLQCRCRRQAPQIHFRQPAMGIMTQTWNAEEDFGFACHEDPASDTNCERGARPVELGHPRCRYHAVYAEPSRSYNEALRRLFLTMPSTHLFPACAAISCNCSMAGCRPTERRRVRGIAAPDGI